MGISDWISDLCSSDLAAELLRDGVAPAVRRADRVRRSDVIDRRLERVVAPLAVHAANWMNGRQVHNVEAHRRDIRQAPGGFGQRGRLRADRKGGVEGKSE